MASIKLLKKSQVKMTGPATKAKVGDPVPSYILTDNEDGSFSVSGVNAAGNSVDISGVATITATSSDAAILSVDAPNGMTVACHGLKAGHAEVAVVATFNDGSVGPFTITVPADVAAGAATGLDVKFSTPTIRG